MASLHGLPPLPKSLSGLSNFTSAQWKELEHLHMMRTMIQQDLNTAVTRNQSESSSNHVPKEGSSQQKKSTSLDAQLALLRKEMVSIGILNINLVFKK